MRYERAPQLVALAIRLQSSPSGLTLDDIRSELSVSPILRRYSRSRGTMTFLSCLRRVDGAVDLDGSASPAMKSVAEPQFRHFIGVPQSNFDLAKTRA